MQSGQSRPRPGRRRGRLELSVLASLLLVPLSVPASLSSVPASSEWGAYLFFAIVATVVVVLLLLHVALGDEPMEKTDRERSLWRASDAQSGQ